MKIFVKQTKQYVIRWRFFSLRFFAEESPVSMRDRMFGEVIRWQYLAYFLIGMLYLSLLAQLFKIKSDHTQLSVFWKKCVDCCTLQHNLKIGGGGNNKKKDHAAWKNLICPLSFCCWTLPPPPPQNYVLYSILIQRTIIIDYPGWPRIYLQWPDQTILRWKTMEWYNPLKS